MNCPSDSACPIRINITSREGTAGDGDGNLFDHTLLTSLRLMGIEKDSLGDSTGTIAI